jgi:hypothetical protein
MIELVAHAMSRLRYHFAMYLHHDHKIPQLPLIGETGERSPVRSTVLRSRSTNGTGVRAVSTVASVARLPSRVPVREVIPGENYCINVAVLYVPYSTEYLRYVRGALRSSRLITSMI